MLQRFSWLLLALFVFAMIGHAVPIFQANDRIVIYGDSITEQRMYSRFLQQYLYVRYPEMKLHVYNAGWSGDQASGALGRLERDVLYLKPTVVTLFFGMNDGWYQQVSDGCIEAYRKNMDGIITALQAKGVRVVVFTPGAVDYDRNANLKKCDYNRTLEALGKTAIELAKKYHCPYADVHQPMLDYQTARKAEDAAFCMIPDSVHPDNNGHLVMAYAMLQGMGAEAMPPLGTVDLHANTADGLRIVTNTAESLVLETLAPALTPFWCEPASVDTLKRSGLLAMAGQRVTVRGLAEGAYDLKVNGVRIGRVSAKELADGYLLPGSFSERGRLVHDLTMRKENNYYNAWRDVRLPLQALPASKEIVAGLMDADEGFHAAIWDAASADKLTLTLTPVPEGANLATGMKYICSNPNQYNWGIGGLTDGSWEASPTHCFASGDADAFPKDVTIDLEKPTMLATIIAGVPHFGSTKTVNVALSLDGKEFKQVGSYVFSLRKEERHTYTFPPVQARYVRLIYPDHYADNVEYNPLFVFTTEVEAYGAKTAGK